MLSHADVTLILTSIAALDQRTIGRSDVLAWTQVLNLAEPSITTDDALAAVAQWHAQNTDGRIRPAHVIQGAQAIARRRAGRARAELLAQQMAELESGDRIDRTADLIELVEDFKSRLGTGDPTVLRRKEWVERERQERRERRYGRNPNYDPRRAAELVRREQDTA